MKKIPACFLTATWMFSSFSYALSECDSILEQGIHNTYSEVSKQDFKNTISRDFCSSSSTVGSNKDSKSGGIGLQIGKWGLDANGSGSSDNFNSVKNRFCSKERNYLNDEGYHTVLSMIVDQNIVDAWSKCTNNRGVVLVGEMKDSTQVDVSVKFLNIFTTYKAKVTSLQFLGLVCPDFVKVGEMIDGNEKVYSCQRLGDQPVTININTDYMGTRLYIPRPKKIEIIEPIKRRPNCTPTIVSGGVVLGPDPECEKNQPQVFVPPPPPPPSGTGRTN